MATAPQLGVHCPNNNQESREAHPQPSILLQDQRDATKETTLEPLHNCARRHKLLPIIYPSMRPQEVGVTLPYGLQRKLRQHKEHGLQITMTGSNF